MAGARSRALDAMQAVAGELDLAPGPSAGAPSYVGTCRGWPVRIEDDVERSDVSLWLTVPSPPAPAGTDGAAAVAMRSVLGRLDPATGAGIVLQRDPELYERATALAERSAGAGQGVLSVHPAEVHGSLPYRAATPAELHELLELARAAGDLYWSIPDDERRGLTPAPRSSARTALVLVAIIIVLLIAGIIGFLALLSRAA